MPIQGRPRNSASRPPKAEGGAVTGSVRIAESGDDVEALLAQLRLVARIRIKAEKDRSYVALRGLTRDERELQDRIRSLRAQRAAERQAASGDATLVQSLIDALREMPPAQRSSVLGAFASMH